MGDRTNDMTDDADKIATNRALWDDRVPAHVASDFYDVEGFKAGRSALEPFEIEEAGPVDGLDLVHLQCHFGLDTLSWARLGAHVTGLDFSEPAVGSARRLASDVGIDADFVASDVYDAVAALGGRTFDVVYTGLGALNWLPDILRWAGVVDALLRPGGFLYLAEFHPFTDVFSYQDLTVETSYWGDPAGEWSHGDGSYVETEDRFAADESWEWNHALERGARRPARTGPGARVVPRARLHALPPLALPRAARRRDLLDARGQARAPAHVLAEGAQGAMSVGLHGAALVRDVVRRGDDAADPLGSIGALELVTPSDLELILHPHRTPGAARVIASGVGASPGVASGIAVFDSARALDLAEQGRPFILVRPMTALVDDSALARSVGVLTSSGGIASHAAILARGRGLPAVCGAGSLRVSASSLTAGDGTVLHEGEAITIDGTTGEVLVGAGDAEVVVVPAELDRLLSWGDEVRAGALGVWANADTADDAARALWVGAEGLGLCRTEHLLADVAGLDRRAPSTHRG